MITVTENNGTINLQGTSTNLPDLYASMSCIILALIETIYEDIEKYGAVEGSTQKAVGEIIVNILEIAAQKGLIEGQDERTN